MSVALLLLAMTPQLPKSPIADGATLKQLAGGLSFAEGPSRSRNGDVYFTDQPNDKILRWDGKTLTTWKSPAGRANGTCFDGKGNLIACADEKNELWSITPDGKTTVLLSDVDGKLLNGPNDVWMRKDGLLYFTDPLYVRDYWHRPNSGQQPGEYVYLIRPRQKPVPVITDFKKPNGIVGTPDGKILYVSDIGAGQTYRYTIEKDGTLSDKSLFCKLGSDGMSIDDEGNVYLTGQGVTIFDRTGAQIGHISVPESWTGNVTFSGKKRDRLFITASKGIYEIQMRTHGAD